MIKKIVLLLLMIPLTFPLTARCAEPDCFPEEMLPDNMFPMVKLETSKGEFSQGIALGIVLIILAFTLNTSLQYFQGKGHLSN